MIVLLHAASCAAIAQVLRELAASSMQEAEQVLQAETTRPVPGTIPRLVGVVLAFLHAHSNHLWPAVWVRCCDTFTRYVCRHRKCLSGANGAGGGSSSSWCGAQLETGGNVGHMRLSACDGHPQPDFFFALFWY
jgi:hypothetical protein